MKVYDPQDAARRAVKVNTSRPATAVMHDAPGVRLVVFRIDPGEQVVPHTSEASVSLTVLSGHGVVSAEHEEREVGPGAVISYAPGELHGMRARSEQFCLMATIARTR